MTQTSTGSARPKIAVLANIYKARLHTQHIVDRILDGYGWDGAFYHPRLDVVSLFVEERGEGDLVPERARRHPEMKVYGTISEALMRGTGKLAVDGVVYIGEQGIYPLNEKGQTEYPRHRFFEEVIDVFRSSGRSVPVYVDKHLSWNWDFAKVMYDASRAMGFPFMAGSSAPVRWRIPSIEMPHEAQVTEAMCVAFGSLDSYDIHALETIQCMVERRNGGETGVSWVEAYRGEGFWRAHERQVWSPELFKAALCRSHMLRSARQSFTDVYPTLDEMKALVKDPVAYHYRHLDGLRCTMMMMNGLVADFNFAAAIEGQRRPLSTQMYASRLAEGATLENYFNPLVHYIEQMILTRKEPYPVERTLLTTGLLCAGIDSLFQGQQLLPTPQLAIRYQPGDSTFRRN
jgi:hypothetical protein